MEKVWKEVEGISNMGEDYEFLAAKKEGVYVEVAYMAFGGLKVVELVGIHAILHADNLHEDVVNNFGDDWEIAFSAITEQGNNVIITIDSCSNINSVGDADGVECTNSMEYDADTIGELDDTLLLLYDIMLEE